ncbi:hypothetical protein [Rhodococcus sp. IEGM 1305]|uniref:hypothetical protein n=1 Tax=Rhodococcus sp. IEGM 1305 TaxID=3047092 RepID=UPI0024B87185|nr:hypothetical protein [Rhodococcus sp. IEGM 1305]MDI9948873.1 hypothetical protein [Rhodococcus sp. IEGM 1305]
MIVIHAPTGFGKSTLAVQWRDGLVAEGVTVAWLTVDHDDNNVVWFLGHVIEAIRVVQPSLAAELGQVLEEHGDEAEQYVLVSLIDEIHERGERVALVIDDWDRVDDAGTIAALEFLLDHGCHHLQLVVTSRNQSNLALSRMRVRDELVEIDPSALRFTPAEAQSLLIELGGIELGTDDVVRLTTTTDGWAAALQLAALSLRGTTDSSALIGQLTGRHHAIGEYLAENVLDRLEPQMLDFLLVTSVPERICGGLASALAQVAHGQAMLEEVERLDLFLHGVDEGKRWFQYQTMFADYLRRRLEREHPDRIAQLHRTASEWFADHRLLSQAVDHALAAGDGNRAVVLVEEAGTNLLEHSQMSTLLGLVAKLPPQVAASRPLLQILVASANNLLRRSGAAAGALQLAESALDGGSASDSDTAELRVMASVIRGVVEVFADRIDGVDDLIAASLAQPESLPPWVVSTAADVASWVALYRFDFDGARRWQDWAIEYHLRTTGPFSAMYGYCFAGIAAHEQLDIDRAEESFRQALHGARDPAGTQSPASRLAGGLLGDLLYERGDIDEAEHLLDECYMLGAEGGVVDITLAAYVTGSRIKALRGDLGLASRRLDEGERISEAHSLPRLRAAITAERVRWGLATLSHTNQPRGGAVQTNGILQIAAEYEETSRLRALMASGSGSDSTLASAGARAMVTKFTEQGRPRSQLQANLLLSAALSAEGRIEEAKQVLADAAVKCSELGLIRFLVDGGPRVVSILTAVRADRAQGVGNSEWSNVSTAFLTDAITAAESNGVPPL